MKVHQDRLRQALPGSPDTSTAAVWAHRHAVKNRLVSQKHKKFSEAAQREAMPEHLTTRSSHHPRVGERVRAQWHTLTAAKIQDRDA